MTSKLGEIPNRQMPVPTIKSGAELAKAELSAHAQGNLKTLTAEFDAKIEIADDGTVTFTESSYGAAKDGKPESKLDVANGKMALREGLIDVARLAAAQKGKDISRFPPPFDRTKTYASDEEKIKALEAYTAQANEFIKANKDLMALAKSYLTENGAVNADKLKTDGILTGHTGINLAEVQRLGAALVKGKVAGQPSFNDGDRTNDHQLLKQFGITQLNIDGKTIAVDQNVWVTTAASRAARDVYATETQNAMADGHLTDDEKKGIDAKVQAELLKGIRIGNQKDISAPTNVAADAAFKGASELVVKAAEKASNTAPTPGG